MPEIFDSNGFAAPALVAVGPVKGRTVARTNLSSGAIGTAVQTVDNYTFITVTVSGAGQTLTIPTPTDTTNSHVVFITNVDSANTVTILGKVLTRVGAAPGTATLVAFWIPSASAWTSNI